MRSTPLVTQYLLLCLPHHGKSSEEWTLHGGSWAGYLRCLNAAGRWAVHATVQSPLLVWAADETAQAQAAAQEATQARGRPVSVVSRGNSDWVEGREIQRYTEAAHAALLGQEPVSEGKSRRLRTEVDKLEAFCQIVQAAAAAKDANELAAIKQAAGKALRAKFGGGSVTSVFAWLAGGAGRDALQSVLTGQVDLTGPLSISEVAAAAEIAQQAELRRSTELARS